MVFLIFFKWSYDFVGNKKVPPVIINLMIKMFLSPGKLEDENDLFPGQVPL